MTFGFQQGTVPPNQKGSAIHMCSIISPVVESLIYSVPNDEIMWAHPDTQSLLVSNIVNRMVQDTGYMSNGGDIRIK